MAFLVPCYFLRLPDQLIKETRIRSVRVSSNRLNCGGVGVSRVILGSKDRLKVLSLKGGQLVSRRVSEVT